MTQVWLRFMLIYQLCEILDSDWPKLLSDSDSFKDAKVGKNFKSEWTGIKLNGMETIKGELNRMEYFR